jgi:hypothetical protein
MTRNGHTAHYFEELVSELSSILGCRRVKPRSSLRAIPSRHNLLREQATAMTSVIRHPPGTGNSISMYPSGLHMTSDISYSKQQGTCSFSGFISRVIALSILTVGDPPSSIVIRRNKCGNTYTSYIPRASGCISCKCSQFQQPRSRT